MGQPFDFAGTTALVTGASSGIGAEFARSLAAKGASLVLVARSVDALEALAAELRQAHGVGVDVVTLDLALPDSAETLAAVMAEHGLAVDVLINNAGFGSHGDVVDADPAMLAQQIQLNVGTLVGTTARFLPGMVARGRGVVVNVASTAAFQPLPHMAVYGATKSFVLSFTQALWKENASTGVKVLALCPGATDTAFFDVAGGDAAVGERRSPTTVVELAFEALAAGRPSVVDGAMNNLLARVGPRIMPERGMLVAAERTMRPGR
ncbi:SDR family NAD(P)-dependent oxidoreductase [Pseudarthrobacter sp. P1]|uniref:SDR family NAD(P)-dependent oxidoreductase n=1 Tax=Pseudarthrobacter sp. P1 TaxID=3418418 RepID=UPI003CE90394